MKLLEILESKFRKNYRTLIFEGADSLSLHAEALQELNLQAGQEVTPQELEHIREVGERKKALEYALLILGYSSRSQREMADKLKRKGFSVDTVNQTIELLRERNLLNDSNLALDLAKSRLKGKKLLGDRGIVRDLKFKGIDDKTISQAFTQAQQEEGTELMSEDDRAYAALLKRRKQIQFIDSRTLQRRLYDYLLRRGFSPDSIDHALLRYRREVSPQENREQNKISDENEESSQ